MSPYVHPDAHCSPVSALVLHTPPRSGKRGQGQQTEAGSKTLRDMVKAQKVAVGAAAVAAAAKAVVPVPAKRAIVPTSPVAASRKVAATKGKKGE